MPRLCYLCRMLLRHELVRLVSKVAKNLGICLVFVTFFAVGCGDSGNGESDKQALMLQHSDKTALQILGAPDDLKFKSCLTLFSEAQSDEALFKQALDVFYSNAAS